MVAGRFGSSSMASRLGRYSALPMLGVAIHGFWEALCVSSCVVIDVTSFDHALPLSPLLMLALVLGIIPSALFSKTQHQLEPQHLGLFALCAGAAALFLGLALQWATWEIVFLLGGSLFAGTLLPPLLTLFFSQVALQEQAILLGVAHTVGEVTALCTVHAIKENASDERQAILLVMIGALLCLGGIFLGAINKNTIDTALPEPAHAARPSRPRAYFISLVLVALLFFLLHSFHDTNYKSFTLLTTGLAIEWRIVSLLCLPLLGVLAVRWGLFPLAALSLALSAFSPALDSYPVNPETYQIVSLIDSVGYHGGFFFLLLTLARVAPTSSVPAFVRSLPYMCMYAAFALTWCLSEVYHPAFGSTMLVSMFALGVSIAGVGWWRQLDDSAASQSPHNLLVQNVAPDSATHSPANRRDVFAMLHGISTREAEVLDLLSEGLSYSQMADRLRIAETTIKVHISRMLKKVGVKNRHQLLEQFQGITQAQND